MSGAVLPGLLLIGGAAAFAVAVLWRWRRCRAGRRTRVQVWRGIALWPRRYLIDVHHAVAREPINAAAADAGARSAVMHALAAGGFVAAGVLIGLVHVLGAGGPAAAWLLLLALAVMGAGVVLVFRRRLVGPLPPRLARGPFDRLPWALGAFVVFFGWTTLPLTGLAPAVAWTSPAALVPLAVGLWGCLELFAGAASGPMRHAASGALHLAFHPRPGRFDREAPDAALRPVDLAGRRLGVARREDFAWNQLLGFDACVQCGRCEAACPAFAAGQPLSPRALIRQLAEAPASAARPWGGQVVGAALDGRGSIRAARDSGGELVGSVVDAEALWACTTCRACVYECPMMIEHVDAVIDLRRFQTLERGAAPGKAADALETLRCTDTVSGRRLGARLDWAADLDVPVLADAGRCDVLLWIGEGGFDLRGQRTLRALVKLLGAARVDFAVLGDEELDCGDLARRLGDEATFQDLARRNIATLERYAFERIVTADPHVLHAIRNEYPALGGRFTVEHHTSLLARLVRAGRLKPALGDPPAVTYHDPCYLGRYQGEFEAPREILAAIGADLREMRRARQRSSCCGWGGGAAFADVPAKRRVPDLRVDEARGTGADTLAVACPNCAVMLEGVVQPRPEVADVAELLWAAVESSATASADS